ncbi:MAG TPA: hypothetical protein VF456_13390 [Vicinamibacterales bacterium]
MARQWLTGGVAMVSLAVAVSACSPWGPHDSVASPSNDPSLTATIRSPLLQTIGDQNTNALQEGQFACAVNNRFTGPIDIVMTAGQNVSLHEVDVSLLDSMLPNALPTDVDSFDDDELRNAFGTTEIPSGTVQTFRFHTDLRCGLRQPQAVGAKIKFIEASGRKNSVTVTVPFTSTVIIRSNP